MPQIKIRGINENQICEKSEKMIDVNISIGF